jgi:staphylococcal nuclease domain-containing protein 1
VHLLENGFVSLQTPRVEEDVTKYFDALRDAEAKGKKDRKGINSGNESKPINFNDLSGGKGKKIDAGRCKNIFPFLKDEKTLTGVIDLVLNGSRFKVRFNQQSILAIMVLEGVRCLPNEGAFAKASEEALQYSKLHANQRDVEI